MKLGLCGDETMRRYGPPTYGRCYIGNTNKMEVHDLDNEKTGKNECQIDEIIGAGNARTFSPDMLSQAEREGYDHCKWCIGGSKR
jgi:hypothetical protein